jgi:hypothetical protein
VPTLDSARQSRLASNSRALRKAPLLGLKGGRVRGHWPPFLLGSARAKPPSLSFFRHPATLGAADLRAWLRRRMPYGISGADAGDHPVDPLQGDVEQLDFGMGHDHRLISGQGMLKHCKLSP